MSVSAPLISTVINIIAALIHAFCIGAKMLECSGGTKRLQRDGQEEEPILVEWLELKDADERNRVNVKHVGGDAERITVGGIVSVKFNSRHHKASVINLLGCTASRTHRAKMQKPPDSATVTDVSSREGKLAVVWQRRPVRTE